MSKSKKGKVVALKPQLSPEKYIKTQARSLPILECFISTGWKDGGLSNVLITRQHKTGNYTVAMLLVDLYLLGVKDAHYEFNIDAERYEYVKENCGPIEACEYELAHNVVYGAIAYAKDYGFKPDPEFAIAQYILEEDTDDVPLMEIEFGYEGKPCYMKGMFDDDLRVRSVIATLTRTAGEGNFTFADLEDDDDFDDEEESEGDDEPDRKIQ